MLAKANSILRLNDFLYFRCLIFASDGLWNVVDPESAVDSIYESERRNEQNAKLGINNWRNPSKVLVETALEKWRSNGLRADNTSVVCVMLDEPNKRNMFKFCRTPNNEFVSNEMHEGSRTIFDYSTSEAYNLDYMSSDVYGNQNIMMQTDNTNVYDAGRSQFYEKNFHQQSYTTAYNSYESSYGYQMASTSQHVDPAPVTYQTSSIESAFVKACCRNNYQLAGINEQIPYHASYEQHRSMYDDMALRPYPPLHYAYRPVPTPQHPLPSLHANLYDHQGYQHNYRPMERYNYLRPTLEEVAAMHNEEDEDDDSDSNTIEFSDEDSDQEEPIEKSDLEKASEDSIQIFEISSSNLNLHEKNTIEDSENSNDEAEKPTKSNNKENTEASARKKKATTPAAGRFYATRQTDRKMRSGNVGSSGITKTIGREKSQRRLARNIRKIAKTLAHSELKPSAITTMTTTTKLSKKIPAKNIENKPAEKRVLRSAPVKEADDRTPIDKVTIRSLRSNGNNSNVMERPTARKRVVPVYTNKDRRLK